MLWKATLDADCAIVCIDPGLNHQLQSGGEITESISR